MDTVNNPITHAASRLDRGQIIDILEHYGHACHDDASNDELRTSLVDDIINGIIPSRVLD